MIMGGNRSAKSSSDPFAISSHIPNRINHSMVFVPHPKSLLVYGGQILEGADLADAWMWDIETASAHPLHILPRSCSSQQITYTGDEEIILFVSSPPPFPDIHF
jgi:hypothetical protein